MAVAHHLGGLFRAVFVAQHQPGRPWLEGQGHLAVVARPAIGIQQRDVTPGQRAPHGARLERLSGGVAHQGGGFRLAEAVSQDQPPGRLQAVDDLGIERFARADQLAQLQALAIGGEILLDQHPPHRGRRAEAGDRIARQHLQQRLGLEARHVMDEHAGAGVPGREDATPGMLGPAGGRDVEVHIARLQTDPIQGGQVPDRIAAVTVQHQLGPRGGPRGEVEQQRIRGEGRAIRQEVAGTGGRRIGLPAGHRRPDADAGEAGIQTGATLRVGAAHHQVGDAPALHPILQIGVAEQSGGGHHHGAQLEGAEQRLPQRHLVAQHHQDAFAAAHTLGAQEIGGAIRRLAQLGEAVALFPALGVEAPQRRTGMLLCKAIEMVQRPVELFQLRPAEIADGGGVVGAMAQQEVPRFAKGVAGRHGRYPAACRGGREGQRPAWRRDGA